MKTITILGTRPEIIKLSPVIPLLEKNTQHKLIHTGQHYSLEMDKIFFDELNLKQPDYALNIGSGSQAYQVGNMMIKIEEILLKEKPDIVIVQGDTNSTLSGALAASKLNIKVCHIEAGCRSFNKAMPEELNRILTDHCSDILLVADDVSEENLYHEGISKQKVFNVGSTVTDACLRSKDIAASSKIKETLGIMPDRYVLVTLHRAENTNDMTRLKAMIEALNSISEKITLIFPAHPRTKKILDENHIKLDKNIKVIEPLGYIDILSLMSDARFIMSDSGGIQEEAAILNTPCLILRNETEWTRLVDIGKNILVGTDKDQMIKIASELIENKEKLQKIKDIKITLQKGVSEKIIEVLKNEY